MDARGIMVAVLLHATLCLAGPEPEPETTALVRQAYDEGRYREALRLAELGLKTSPTTKERLELHQYAGMISLLLKDEPTARRHLTALLRLAPDYQLDPFFVPPPVVEYFEALRRTLSREPPAAALVATPTPEASPSAAPASAAAPTFRHFSVALGIQQLVPFNRIVQKDELDNEFRNRTPFGPILVLGFGLNPRWQLFGEASYSFMHVYPRQEDVQPTKYLDYQSINVLVGARGFLDLDSIRLWVGLSVGSVRMFLSAFEGGVVENGVAAQALAGDLSGGVDIPFLDRFGLLLRVGLRAQVGTETIGKFRSGISFSVARDGFLWGLQDSVELYVRF